MIICPQQTKYSTHNFFFMFCQQNMTVKYYTLLEVICCLYHVFILANKKKTLRISSYFNGSFHKKLVKNFKRFYGAGKRKYFFIK